MNAYSKRREEAMPVSGIRTKTTTVTGLVIALEMVFVSATHAQIPNSEPYAPIDWPSKPPPDCPFEPSKDIVGIKFTGRHREYTNADCWFPSWASDGNMYSPFSDGTVENVLPDGGRARIRTLGVGAKTANTAYGKIVGDDPMNLTVIGLGTFPAPTSPYDSRYPSGSLVHDGIWYYGNHPEGPEGLVHLDGDPHAWPWMGPFIGFRISHDFGKTWTDSPHTPARPLFDESTLDEDGKPKGVPVRIGEPFFVDFGKNMEHSPDGKAYLVAHGATEPGANPRAVKSSWCIGDQAYLLRVVPSPKSINDASKYEFFAGHDRLSAHLDPIFSEFPWPPQVTDRSWLRGRRGGVAAGGGGERVR